MALHGDPSCNSLENPIGIETKNIINVIGDFDGCNSLENPIGIETIQHHFLLILSCKLQLIGKPDRD